MELAPEFRGCVPEKLSLLASHYKYDPASSQRGFLILTPAGIQPGLGGCLPPWGRGGPDTKLFLGDHGRNHGLVLRSNPPPAIPARSATSHRAAVVCG